MIGDNKEVIRQMRHLWEGPAWAHQPLLAKLLPGSGVGVRAPGPICLDLCSTHTTLGDPCPQPLRLARLGPQPCLEFRGSFPGGFFVPPPSPVVGGEAG